MRYDEGFRQSLLHLRHSRFGAAYRKYCEEYLTAGIARLSDRWRGGMGSGIAAVWGMLHAAVQAEALLFFPMPARSQGRRSVVAVVGAVLENYLEYLPIGRGNNRLVFWGFTIPIAGEKVSTVIS